MPEGLGDSIITGLTGCYPGKPSPGKCQVCGSELVPAPARFDGDPTFVGFLPCKTCQENKEIAARTRDYHKYLESGAD